MVLRPGNVSSNTAADHLSVLDQALTQIPDRRRSKTVLIRADGAGYSHALIAALSEQQLDFSVGKTVTKRSETPSGWSPPGPRRWAAKALVMGGVAQPLVSGLAAAEMATSPAPHARSVSARPVGPSGGHRPVVLQGADDALRGKFLP